MNMWSVSHLATRLQSGELSPSEAVQHFLDRIAASDDELNAYITVAGEQALEQAEALERSSQRGPLWGVPIAIKDVIDVAELPTTAGSKIRAGHVASEDAHVVARLRVAGAIFLGKLNSHEFAYGPLTTSPHFGPARNPWSLDRVCGGSSGGSGAAVAAGLAAGSLGTDTAGSIRIPSAFCGITGVRPSLGLTSGRGLVPLAWSFDTVGPMASSVDDCALLLEVMVGPAPTDSATADVDLPSYREALDGDVKGLRVGVLDAFFERGVDPRVAEVVETAVGDLRALGMEVKSVDLPVLERASTVLAGIQFPEATALHLPLLQRYLADYGDDVRQRLLAGLFLPSTLYVTARRARQVVTHQIQELLERFDLLVSPTMPVIAPRLANGTIEVEGLEDVSGMPPELMENIFRMAILRLTAPWSLAGSPVVTVPAGFVDGMPVGLSLAGRRFEEQIVLRAAHAFQVTTDHLKAPGESS